VFFLACFFCASTGSGWQITGSVKDDAGNAIADVPVSAYGHADNTNGSASAITGPDGAFVLHVFDAIWQVSVDADTLNSRGYRRVSSDQFLVSGGDGRVDFVCPKVIFTTRLSGQAVDDHGAPLTNAAISASVFDGSFQTKTNTDATGHFALPLFGGFWDLGVSGPDLLLPRIALRAIDGVDQTNFLAIARTPSATVVASVRDASGNITLFDEPIIVSASMTVGPTNYSSDGSMDADGTFTFALSEGNWELNAYVFAGNSNVAIEIPNRSITVAGTYQEVFWAALTPTNHLKGQVLDGAGGPISNVPIYAQHIVYNGFTRYGTRNYSWPTIALAETSTDVDGRFDLIVLGGLWNLGVANPFTNGARAVVQDVAVTEGMDRTNVQIVAPQFTSQIIGTVQDTFGHAVENLLVVASAKINAQVFQSSAFTDHEGSFRLPAFDADWKLNGSPYYLSRLNYRSTGATIVPVRGSNEVADFILQPVTNTVRLIGQLVDSAGAPVSQLPIAAYTSDGSYLFPSQTGYWGAFELDVFAGSWLLYAGNFQAGGDVFLGPRVSIGVQSGADQTNLFLVARKATAQITGTVIDAEARAMSGLFVSAATDLQITNYSINTRTDEDGHFELDIIDGAWKVWVEDHTLNALGLQSQPARSVTFPGANQTVMFDAQRIIGDGRVATLASPIRLGNGTIQLTVTSQTLQRYRIETSSNLLDWIPAFTNATRSGSFTFTNAPGAVAQSRFYRAVLLE